MVLNMMHEFIQAQDVTMSEMKETAFPVTINRGTIILPRF